jgi:hypothetical protein
VIQFLATILSLFLLSLSLAGHMSDEPQVEDEIPVLPGFVLGRVAAQTRREQLAFAHRVPDRHLQSSHPSRP